jgi:hypothetical protein
LHEEPTQLARKINDGAILFLSSDGSVIDDKYGSYGFTETHVPSKKRLATGHGPASGDAPSSFRAEAYGVLAVGRFLVRLSEYTGISIQQTVKHWIDNEAVVNRLKQEVGRKYYTPNSTLQADWDIINEIHRTF